MTLKISSDNISATTLTTISGVKISAVTYAGSTTAADLAGGETITVTGSGFNSGITVYVDTTSCTTTYVSSTSLTFTSPAKSIGSYHLYVYNTDGGVGMKPSGYVSSSLPTWVTSSGALPTGSTNSSYSQSVTATGDGTITYSLTSGSLPTGLSLNTSTGAITGTPTVEATSNFTITATDSQNQTTSRAFSIQIATVVQADYLIVAGGGSGGTGYYGGGGGAGGLLTGSITLSPAVPYTITIGGGGTGSNSTLVRGGAGSNSSFNGSGLSTITTYGGGGGGSRNGDAGGGAANGGNGGSGGGASFPISYGGKGVYTGSTYLSQPRQGYDGADALTYGTEYGNGGGGAGEVGHDITTFGNRNGGVGLASSITGSSTYYAGGGGGGYGSHSGGSGGGGGGGLILSAGTVNTGGGGGGAYYSTANGGSGGSGVFILRFSSTVNVTSTTGSPTITTDGSYNVYKFTSSGSITF